MEVPRSAARRLGLKGRRTATTLGRTVSVAQAGRTTTSVLRLGRRHRIRLREPGKRVGLKLKLLASAGPSGSVKKERRVVLRP